MIKFTTKQMITVQDWDELVGKTYGRPYSFQQEDGCKERGTHDITVPDKGYDSKNETIPEEINGGPQEDYHII